MTNTILIVDDLLSNLLVLEKILKQKRYKIFTASSAADAIEIFKNQIIDLCLLDVNMPDMDGFELVEELQKCPSTSEPHFIFVTGLRNNRMNELKGINFGAIDYIEKPVDQEVLATKVQVHLDKINKTKELQLENLELRKKIVHIKQLEEQLLLTASAFDQASNAILITDRDQKIIRINKAFMDITGYSEKEAIGRTPHLLSSGKHDKHFYKKMWQSLNSEGSWSGEIWNKRKNGDIFPELQNITVLKDDNNQPRHYVAIFTDLTLHKKQLAQIERLTRYDSLTKLPNKQFFDSLLTEVIAKNELRNSSGALLFFDINEFKKYNNTFGYKFGDQLLFKFSRLLMKVSNDYKARISRYGGDEFIIWLSSPNAIEDAKTLANRIQKELLSSICIDEYNALITCSVGISAYPQDGNRGDILLRKAETAMYQSKSKGLHTYKIFKNEMADSVRYSLQIEDELRLALSRGDLELYYQPQVDLKSNKIIGAEALIRWKHKDLGFVSPAKFIPIAEKSSLIVTLGNQVITEACQQIRIWEQNGLFDSIESVSINVSPVQFEFTSFIEILKESIETSGIDSSHLVIELTETALINNNQAVVNRLNLIKDMGCSISIDDFGTGYSSLQYLSTFPVDVLKIDKCFIDNISHKPADLAVVNAIVAMGQMINAKIIVEGVEHEEQLDIINANNGCNAYQGYFYSPAVIVSEFERLVSNLPYPQRRSVI